MALSKPIMSALGTYFEQLYVHPIRTKAISLSIISAAGNYASQYIAGKKVIDHQSLLAYAAFGLLFGGTIPHFFDIGLEKLVPEEAAFTIFKRLFVERLLFTPLFQAFTLYSLARLEGKSHPTAVKELESLYWKVISSSWKYLTLIQLINFSVVPPMFRVFIMNIVTFFWTIYIANKRRQEEIKSKKGKK